MDEFVERSIPVLKIDDYDKAKAFYVDWLGFEIVFEWRHEPNLPVYMGITRGNLVLHLTEHKGDVKGYGGAVNQIENVHAFYAELKARNENIGAAPKSMPWDSTIFSLADPFGNRLTFTTPNEYLRIAAP
jgi:catechol 2,3-dioxygenase-like lactoylglutathione lyase family enzyme